MRTVRRLLYRDIALTVSFVALAFLALFSFIAFTEELERLKRGQSAGHAAWLAALQLPGQLYELLPIAVLIGSIISLSRLAQSSEFTILRTAGLGPGRALGLLSLPALAFALLTFLSGDVLAPIAERAAESYRAELAGGLLQRAGGAWLKDREQSGTEQERSFTVHVQAAGLDGRVEGVRVFAFDAHGRLLERWESPRGEVDGQGLWILQNVTRALWPQGENIRLEQTTLPELRWQSHLSLAVVNAALLKASTMSTAELFRYTRHLSAQEQSAGRYEIQFYRKALYPFACLVMMALALPFAYLHGRAGGIGAKVFGGIMLGISFVLMNHLAGHLGLLQGWAPWAAAAAPALFYLALSLSSFAWLVRYR
ncbi:lipopolysaccharide export system permease protein [Inhella inkyongensis]|uniref:Lipopolysaccharide export system permease protein n=1 Tax=Inhella inkyongensis TaxID=392593 RepID=A0A840S7N8_9BURK|nr:LPS export ABC transporter permease LptG [Inhella inkyongensis]MBB5205518.1 lipopolysaccharide export system permease protein [Inhella inkyongensis]